MEYGEWRAQTPTLRELRYENNILLFTLKCAILEWLSFLLDHKRNKKIKATFSSYDL